MGLAVAGVMMGCKDDSVTTPTPPPPQATVYTATGNIAAKVDEFRTLLGASNGGTAGEQAGGRREISWDGAGANPFGTGRHWRAGGAKKRSAARSRSSSGPSGSVLWQCAAARRA